MNSKLTLALRLLLVILLLIFGGNKFINFLPMPPLPPENFINHIIATGYLWKLIGLIEITVAVLLLLNKWKGFALIILAPITVNVILYHLNFDLAGIGPGALVAILNALLIYENRALFKPLFKS